MCAGGAEPGPGGLRGNARALEGREGREGVNEGGRGRGRREGGGDFFIINLFSGPLWLRGGRPGGEEEGGRQQRYGGDSGGCCCRRCRREAKGPARRPFKLARAAGPAGPSLPLAASLPAEGALCAGPSAALPRCRGAGEGGRGAKGERGAALSAVSVPALPAASERPRLG